MKNWIRSLLGLSRDRDIGAYITNINPFCVHDEALLSELYRISGCPIDYKFALRMEKLGWCEVQLFRWKEDPLRTRKLWYLCIELLDSTPPEVQEMKEGK